MDADSRVLMTGACFGAGLDIISAADIRYCSADAYFCVKEVDLAIAAEHGSAAAPAWPHRTKVTKPLETL